MLIQEFNKIKEKANTYTYQSFEYLEYEHVENFELVRDDKDLLLIYGWDAEKELHAAYWAVNDITLLTEAIKGLGHDILINFIPGDWKPYFLKHNFTEYGVFRDYRVEDLKAVDSLTDYTLIKEEEYEQAALVTRLVQNQSRGFHGETKEWIERWVKGEDPDAKAGDTRDCNILVHRNGKTVTGIACIGIYDTSLGPCLWVREVAVSPEEQGKGIGKKLLLQSFGYGLERGATRAFLMADDCNTNAIGLYKKVGFVPSGDPEINMISP